MMMEVLKLLSAVFVLTLPFPAASHVVDKFSNVSQCEDFFLNGTTPNIPHILINGNVQDQNRYKPICQLFKNKYRFATLYDTFNRIPVFSAYTYTGKVAGRPTHPWMIEPQLEDGNADQSMNTSEKDVQYEHQAGNIDFNNSIVVKGVNRGHLFPCSHAPDNDTKMSTFTLTNVVPQAESFNGGSWNQMECRVRDLLQNQCVDNNNMTRAYVVTGAVASQNNTLNNRVNIPSVMWTAYCCYNSMTREWMAQAHWGNNTHTTGRDLPSETLGALYDMLSLYNQTGVQMFPEVCPINYTSPVQGKQGYTREECIYDKDCVCITDLNRPTTPALVTKSHYFSVLLIPLFLFVLMFLG